jgi:hypothetical protein
LASNYPLLCWRKKEASNVKLAKSLGFLLLGIWLILTGLISVLSFSFVGLESAQAVHTVLHFLPHWTSGRSGRHTRTPRGMTWPRPVNDPDAHTVTAEV